jgi:hypothetical protein
MSKTLVDALNFFPTYPHNKDNGTGYFCDVRQGRFCSICSAGSSIAWIVRNVKDVKNPYDTAKFIFDQWSKEKWDGAEHDRPYIMAMLNSLRKFQNKQQ